MLFQDDVPACILISLPAWTCVVWVWGPVPPYTLPQTEWPTLFQFIEYTTSSMNLIARPRPLGIWRHLIPKFVCSAVTVL
jgi:hypothetical protein